jgi:hypothetical protein
MTMFSIKRCVTVVALGFSLLMTPGVVSASGPLDGLTVPPADPALMFVEPTPDQPNYDARLQAFIQATVPDDWNGQPVGFYSTLSDTGVDALGLPTSGVAADPNNPQFIYQRFQNGVLFYNGAEGTTSVLPFQ